MSAGGNQSIGMNRFYQKSLTYEATAGQMVYEFNKIYAELRVYHNGRKLARRLQYIENYAEGEITLVGITVEANDIIEIEHVVAASRELTIEEMAEIELGSNMKTDLYQAYFKTTNVIIDEELNAYGVGINLLTGECKRYNCIDSEEFFDSAPVYKDMVRSVIDNTGTIVRPYVANENLQATEQVVTPIVKHYVLRKRWGNVQYTLISTSPFSFSPDPLIAKEQAVVTNSCVTDGSELSHRYVGSFPGVSSGGSYRSVPGSKPTATINIGVTRANISAFGLGFANLDIDLWETLTDLVTIETGRYLVTGRRDRFDTVLGSAGATSSDIPNNGLTIPYGNRSGVVVNNTGRVVSSSYRGIENLYGLFRTFIDGINVEGSRVYRAKPKSPYQHDNSASPYTDTGLDLATTDGESISELHAGTYLTKTRDSLPVDAGYGPAGTTIAPGDTDWKIVTTSANNIQNPDRKSMLQLELTASSTTHWSLVSRPCY